MSPKEATAEVFFTALKALPKAQRDAVIARIAKDRAFREDLRDLAIFESRKKEPSRPFREYVAEGKCMDTKAKSEYVRSINLIVDFKDAFSEIDTRVSRKLVGILGELYVLAELEKRGYKPKAKGGCGRCDIALPLTKMRVEVKTSLLKNEGLYDPRDIEFYGFTVEGKREPSYDYLICVCLDDTFTKPKFYVLTREEALSIDVVKIPRYKGTIRRKIHIFRSQQDFEKAVLSSPLLVTAKEREINQQWKKFRGAWNKLGKPH